MTKLQKKIKLEGLKVKIGINTEIVSHEIYKETDTPHMHDYYVEKLNEYKEEYLELLRSVLVPNKTYAMDMGNSITLWDDTNNIVSFLYKNMIYGEYKDGYEDYFYDKSTPGKIHKYCNAGKGTMSENRAEIVECLHVSDWTFKVEDNGMTVITGRAYDWDTEKIYVVLNKDIFDTDLIMNISLTSI
jgi:hypothetical protein